MALFALLVSIVCVLATVFFYWRFRRRQELSTKQLSNRVSGLLSEFNAVSASKVEQLDERTGELRRVVELADLKIKKLNRLIDRAEGARKQLERRGSSASSGDDFDQSLRERVLERAQEGASPEEIARDLEMKPGEVSVIVRLNRSRLTGS